MPAFSIARYPPQDHPPGTTRSGSATPSPTTWSSAASDVLGLGEADVRRCSASRNVTPCPWSRGSSRARPRTPRPRTPASPGRSRRCGATPARRAPTSRRERPVARRASPRSRGSPRRRGSRTMIRSNGRPGGAGSRALRPRGTVPVADRGCGRGRPVLVRGTRSRRRAGRRPRDRRRWVGTTSRRSPVAEVEPEQLRAALVTRAGAGRRRRGTSPRASTSPGRSAPEVAARRASRGPRSHGARTPELVRNTSDRPPVDHGPAVDQPRPPSSRSRPSGRRSRRPGPAAPGRTMSPCSRVTDAHAARRPRVSPPRPCGSLRPDPRRAVRAGRARAPVRPRAHHEIRSRRRFEAAAATPRRPSSEIPATSRRRRRAAAVSGSPPPNGLSIQRPRSSPSVVEPPHHPEPSGRIWASSAPTPPVEACRRAPVTRSHAHACVEPLSFEITRQTRSGVVGGPAGTSWMLGAVKRSLPVVGHGAVARRDTDRCDRRSC